MWIRGSILVGAVLLSLASLSAQNAVGTQKPSRDWMRVALDSSLEVVGNASAREMTDALTQLHAFRSTLDGILPRVKTGKDAPTTLVVFRDGNTFLKFLPRDGRGRKQYGVIGYFTDLPDANFMVVPAFASREDTFETAFHEYTHYLVARRAPDLPRWLDEGFAEFYSTFHVREGYGLVGTAPAGWLKWLNGPNRIPHVRQLLTSDPRLFTNFNDTLAFYAQSWLVVHYMILGEQGRRKEQFARYLDLARERDPEAAAREAFGMGFDDLDRTIRHYGQRGKLPALRVGNPVESPKPSVQPMTHVDALTLQARLLLEVGGARDAEPLIEEALALDGTFGAARLLRGRLRLQQRRYAEALDDLAAAVERAPQNFAAHYYRGTALYAAGNFELALKAFDTALEINASSAPTWFGLSLGAMALGRTAQAEAMLKRVRALDGRPRWYYERAIEALKQQRHETALSDARAFVDLAGASDDSSPYAAFVAVVASRRLGRPDDGRALLSRVTPLLEAKGWPRVVADYMAGSLGDDEFVRRARDDGQRTEARTYVALRLIDADRIQEAIPHLEWVRDKGERAYTEYGIALAELRRLESGATVSR